MSSPASPPDPAWPADPRLAEIARTLDKTDWWAWLLDDRFHLVWASRAIHNEWPEASSDEIGIGKHMTQVWVSDLWRSAIPEDDQPRLFAEFTGLMTSVPGWEDTLPPDLPDPIRRLIDTVEPRPLADIYSTELEIFHRDLIRPLRALAVPVRDGDGGALVGAIFVTFPGLDNEVVDMLIQGDVRAFQRMARLTQPGRRRAAILFADLQDSGELSSRLSSGAYFNLISELTSAVDAIVIDRGGIVGKHAGDGMTSFFLVEECGGDPSTAARMAIDAAREIGIAARRVAKDLGERTGAVSEDEVKVNVGLHWGGTLYMGQLVTGGRLEVTALGDEVNEGARIQEAARDGRILASKALIEHLTGRDAAALGLDPDLLSYRKLAEFPEASIKAVRDAGGLAVTEI